MLQPPIALDCLEPTLRAGAQGIARVAVVDAAAQLIVTFEQPVTQAYLLSPRSYSLTGGERLFPHILGAQAYDPPGEPSDLVKRRVQLQLDGEGDFSVYTLTVSGPDIDPFFSSHTLRFRLACEDPFDCREPPPVPPAVPELPVIIDYLAKDYASFRQALLDFIPTRLPAWTERSEADIGMMLLELFAATADTLSYMQDRVANEAFLDSATQRRSVAEHLALLGYQMDQGASAYTWLQFQVNTTTTLSSQPGLRVSNKPSRADEPLIVFETETPDAVTVTLRPEHNQMTVYDWEHQNCCLPSDALSVALVGSYNQLEIGDYLLFDDRHGQRDIVRLTARPQIVPHDKIKAHPSKDLTILHWSRATPLHHDYCVPDLLVRGNLALATHGETVTGEALRKLTADQIAELDAEIAARPPGQRTPRQRLRLAQGPLAYLDASTLALANLPMSTSSPATTPADFTARTARSVSTLKVWVDGDSDPWQEELTLLNSRGDAKVYRVEIDDAGEATVVFGNNTFGLQPAETSTVTADYRIGGGQRGNMGADTLVLPQPRATDHISWLDSVTNPLPAVGGRDLESREHARRVGPATFQELLVAVTAADYEAAAPAFIDTEGQQPIQRAKAEFRWTGSWLTVMLAVDPVGAEGLSDDLRSALLAYLNTRRLAGYDLEIRRALYLPIDLMIEFCLLDGFLAGNVQQALTQALSNGDLPGGRKGFFHPNNFSFGDNLYISQLYAAIMAVPGVESATITRLARLWADQPAVETFINLRRGYLEVAADQIVRLDNDRSLPQNGTLTIQPKGGGR